MARVEGQTTGAEWTDMLNQKPDPECSEPECLKDNSVNVLERPGSEP